LHRLTATDSLGLFTRSRRCSWPIIARSLPTVECEKFCSWLQTCFHFSI